MSAERTISLRVSEDMYQAIRQQDRGRGMSLIIREMIASCLTADDGSRKPALYRRERFIETPDLCPCGGTLIAVRAEACEGDGRYRIEAYHRCDRCEMEGHAFDGRQWYAWKEQRKEIRLA